MKSYTVFLHSGLVSKAWLLKLNAELVFSHFRYKNPKLVPISEHYRTFALDF